MELESFIQRTVLALVLAAALLGAVFALSLRAAAAAAPCDDLLAGLERNRWRVEACGGWIEGEMRGTYPSSSGAYWLILNTEEGEYWGKVYPDRWPIRKPTFGERIRVYGPLVKDYIYPTLREIVPVIEVRGEVVREYNEQRADGSWWFVEALADGTYRERLIETTEYKEAGIQL